jgi:hypothetical protein
LMHWQIHSQCWWPHPATNWSGNPSIQTNLFVFLGSGLFLSAAQNNPDLLDPVERNNPGFLDPVESLFQNDWVLFSHKPRKKKHKNEISWTFSITLLFLHNSTLIFTFYYKPTIPTHAHWIYSSFFTKKP